MTDADAHTILVTGAGGFVGSATATVLEQAGFVVRRGVRRPATGGVLCDLDRPDTVADALRGVDLVVHAAYGEAAGLERQCRTLLAAMETAGVFRLIHLSSIAVYGDATGAVDETTPLRAVDAYGQGKIACETAIAAWADAASAAERRALVLRPGIIYGRGSPFWIDKLVERIRLGAWGVFGAQGEGPAALVHVADVADCIAAGARALLSNASPDGSRRHIVNLVGPDTPSWNAYFTALAYALGAGPLPHLAGNALKARQAASVVAKVWRKLGLPGGRALALTPTPGEIALFARNARYGTGACAAFGYTPHIPLAEGLRRSLNQAKA